MNTDIKYQDNYFYRSLLLNMLKFYLSKGK